MTYSTITITKTYDLDLYYGNIEIGYTEWGGCVTYSDSEGEHTESYLSSDTIFNISQSSSSTPTANTIAITGWYNEIPINISIDGLNISTEEKENIVIGNDIQVNLIFSGESTLICNNGTANSILQGASSGSVLYCVFLCACGRFRCVNYGKGRNGGTCGS